MPPDGAMQSREPGASCTENPAQGGGGGGDGGWAGLGWVVK